MRGFETVMPGLSFRLPATTIVVVAIAAVVLVTLAAILPARGAPERHRGALVRVTRAYRDSPADMRGRVPMAGAAG